MPHCIIQNHENRHKKIGSDCESRKYMILKKDTHAYVDTTHRPPSDQEVLDVPCLPH